MRFMCRFASVACVVALTVAAAGQDFGEWFGAPVGRLSPRATVGARGYLQQDVDGQDAEMCWVDHRLAASIPLSQGETYDWSVFTGVRALDFHTGATLPDAGERFPGELWDVRFGTASRTVLDNGWTLGGRLQVGSPSDHPFASLDEVVLSADAFLRVPWRESLSWIFLLNVSTNREFLPCVPIPGVALAYEPSEQLRLLAGVPLSSVHWEPLDRLELDASYLLLRNVHAQVGYRIAEGVKVYGGFDWDNDVFLRHDRRDEDDRLFHYEKRLTAGVRWDITRNVFLDGGTGWAFDRFWFEGEDYGDRGERRLGLDDGPFVFTQLGIRF